MTCRPAVETAGYCHAAPPGRKVKGAIEQEATEGTEKGRDKVKVKVKRLPQMDTDNCG